MVLKHLKNTADLSVSVHGAEPFYENTADFCASVRGTETTFKPQHALCFCPWY